MVRYITDGNSNYLSYDTEQRIYSIMELNNVAYELVTDKVLENIRRQLMRENNYRMKKMENLSVNYDDIYYKPCASSVRTDRRTYGSMRGPKRTASETKIC